MVEEGNNGLDEGFNKNGHTKILSTPNIFVTLSSQFGNIFVHAYIFVTYQDNS